MLTTPEVPAPEPSTLVFAAVAIAGLAPRHLRSRHRFRVRQLQARDGQPADYTAGEWVTQEITFALKSLKHPSEDQKAILRAIWRSAREIMPEPGEKIRAVGLPRHLLQAPFVHLKPGYLPPENLVASY